MGEGALCCSSDSWRGREWGGEGEDPCSRLAQQDIRDCESMPSERWGRSTVREQRNPSHLFS
jgi:hypothetical protein